MPKATVRPKHIAIVGAGMAGIVCARTLVQAGHRVTVFERHDSVGGRMATRNTAFGSFDHGAQYFTVRDDRFALALATTPGLCKPWSANAVRVLDAAGNVAKGALPSPQAHFVPVPGMSSLVRQWSLPLVQANSQIPAIELNTHVERIERDAINPALWQLRTDTADDSHRVFSGFDAVLLALPAANAKALLKTSAVAPKVGSQMAQVSVAPCWTLMAAFPNASQPNLNYLGPQWNATLSTHHRIAWLARESSKPGRDRIERWTVQANPEWSQEHIDDAPERVQAKLLKAFAEVTGIRATPAHVDMHLWRYAKTQTPLGKSHLWDGKLAIGVAGDWCLGHRVEDAFVSGLELALAVVDAG